MSMSRMHVRTENYIVFENNIRVLHCNFIAYIMSMIFITDNIEMGRRRSLRNHSFLERRHSIFYQSSNSF